MLPPRIFPAAPRGTRGAAQGGTSRFPRAPLPEPALAEQRLVAVRQPLDEVLRSRETSRALDLAGGRIRTCEGDVRAHGVAEEERLREDEAHGAAQILQAQVAHVDAVDRHAAAVD